MVLGYALNVGAVGLVTLLTIPFMISVGGVDAWASAALGQSVGVIAAVVIGYGWAISGPAIIAKAAPGTYITVLKESVKTRLFLLLPTLCGAVLICIFVIPHGLNKFTLLGVVSTALLGLRFNWFLIGLNKPYVMLLAETLPRVGSTALGLAAMRILDDMAIAIVAQAIGVLLGSVITGWWARLHVRPFSSLTHPNVSGLKDCLLAHRFGMSAAIVSALYSSGPLILLGVTSPAAVGTYAVLDRLAKQLFTAASPVIDAFRGWVPRTEQGQQIQRSRAALIVAAVSSALAAVALAIFGARVVTWFSDGEIVAGQLTMVAFGLLFGISLFHIVLAQVVLISFDLTRHLFQTGVMTACVGLSLAALLSGLYGIIGLIFALITAAALGVIRNFYTLRKHISEI